MFFARRGAVFVTQLCQQTERSDIVAILRFLPAFAQPIRVSDDVVGRRFDFDLRRRAILRCGLL
ncbi:hypothetical protein ACT2FY_38785 [Paraburkholderia fungorum]|uniref:hypothetical protein n=1 Tax=Paraburkholderia fungorum TaxID=134537 RepID=UPI00402BD68C